MKKLFVIIVFLLGYYHCPARNHQKYESSELVRLKNDRPDTNTINKLFDYYSQYRQSDPLLALQSLQNAIDIAELIDNKGKIGWLLYHKGYVYRQLGIYNLAALCYLKSLEIFEKRPNKDFYAWILISIGNLYLDEKNNLSISLDHFSKAHEVFKDLGNNVGVIVSDYCIGQIYMERKDFNKALSWFNAAAILSHQIKESKHEIIALSYIGETFQKRGQMKKSIETYNKALQISLENNNFDGMGRVYSQLGSAYESMDSLAESISNYTKALKAYVSISDKSKIAVTLNKIANLNDQQGRTLQAIDYAKKALAVADSNNLLNQQEAILPKLVEYYKKSGKVLDAFLHLKRYTDLKESNIKKNAQQIEHEYELQLMKKEKMLSEEKIKRHNIITAFSTGGLIIFLVFILLILLKNRKLKESYHHLYNNYLLLSKKDEEIEKIKKQTKYVGSSLKDQQQLDLLAKLNALMNEKIFLRKDLNLDMLADKLETNRSYLSQVINDEYGLNFNNFINEHRVKEAKKMLIDPSKKMLTIEAIAQNVGFNSKSSFNLAFKKVTGLTPSDFIEMKEKEV